MLPETFANRSGKGLMWFVIIDYARFSSGLWLNKCRMLDRDVEEAADV